MELATGSVIGEYRIGALLDEDGETITYRVVRLEDGEDFVVRIVMRQKGDYRERLQRAAEEAKARLDHPNVVRVHDVIEVEGHSAVVMDFVNGSDLATWLEAHHPPVQVALHVFKGIVRGLGAAHEAGMVHRNLKPAKILVGEHRGGMSARINDFTLVKIEKAGGKKLTQMGIAFGTPQYMAPEQFRDVSGVDRRADLFALGCILYEMVCGERTFPGKDIMTIYQAVSTGDFVPPREHVADLPDNVSNAIEALLQIDPKKRPGSCDELLEILYGSAEPSSHGRDPDEDDDEALEVRSDTGPMVLAAVGALVLTSVVCGGGASLLGGVAFYLGYLPG